MRRLPPPPELTELTQTLFMDSAIFLLGNPTEYIYIYIVVCS